MRTGRLRSSKLLSIGVLCILAHALSFAQEEKISVSQLTQRSEVVVIGKVISVRSGWNDDRTKIHTLADIAIQEQLKGTVAQTTITILTLGGEVNGIGESYSHAAKFIRDEHVVVFASRHTSGQYRTTAGDQGKYTVKDEGGMKMIAETLSLDQLRSTVRQTVRKGSNK
jgi:hypothetical protein